MVRSMTKRGMPKPFAILIATLMALYFVPFSALNPASATGFQYTLEGCRLAAGNTLPNADGKFICTDAEYTTGNLGKSWNELDLVPHRVTVSGSGEAQFVIAADNEDAGHPGYDIISEPVVNAAKSSAGCSVTSSAQQTQAPGQGGADKTIYRVVTLEVPTNGTCVIDYYQRLALGSHLYPGSSLHSNLLSTNLDTGGIGSKEVSIPVKEILPQTIDKTMTATQGSTYAWTVAKQASPTTVTFANTCEQSNVSRTQDVSITVNWTRSAKTGSGDILLTTDITATNPAHREITVNVTDKMYAGSDQSNLLATSTGSFDVPASSTHDFIFTKTVSSSASTFNDVATATYTDKATGIAVPGTTTASATATVADNGQTTGASATISDVESISGAGFSYTVNSVTPSQGSFGAYTLGTNTTSDVTFSDTISPSGTGAASGSYVFAKTITVAAGTVGNGTLQDTATLTPAGQSAQTAHASVDLTADAANPTLRFTKTVDLAPETDATFTFTVRAKDGQGDPTGPTYTFTVTIPAGQTSASSDFQTVAPSANGYHYTEQAAGGYTGVDGDIGALAKCDVKTVTVNNTRDLGEIKIHKTIQGDVGGAGTDFTAHVDCPGTAYDQDVALNQDNNWTGLTGDIPTGTQCTITETDIPAGWSLVSITPDTVAVSKGTPADVTVEITNARDVGKIKIHKALDGDPAGASTDFTAHVDCPGTTYDQDVALNQDNNWTGLTGNIPTGTQCTITETGIPAGWSLVSITPDTVTVGTGSPVDVTSTITNSRDVGRIAIHKAVQGDVAGASTDFTAHVDCSVDAYDQDVALTEGNQWTGVTGDIPTGVQCTITEVNIPAGWSLVSITPDTVTVGQGDPVTVTITNKRDTGVITVTKVLVGAANGAATSFTFDVDCPGTAYDQSVVVDVTNGTSASATTTAIPTGLSCTVTERATPDWRVTAVVPAGGVVAVGSTVTFTNTRLEGTLNISKKVSPVAGNGIVVNFGDTLTYTLTVSATGDQRQPNAVVRDYLPGRDPAHPSSGNTTYVAGSATCIGAGTCTVTGPDASGLITWHLGEMAAGTTRLVTFKVIINDVSGKAGTTIAEDVINQASVQSDRTPLTPSNVVKTPVSKVLPVKIGPKQLPHTGAALPVGPTVGGGVLLLGLGILLVATTRRRRGLLG
jgi:uncharacterized repeat protein (TIGR01451 family)